MRVVGRGTAAGCSALRAGIGSWGRPKRLGRDHVGLAGRVVVARMSRASWALVAVLAAGCTMCPDPYDYTGPVPNGAPPQNDFRARSNGILPLGAAPTPWPLIVHGDAGRGLDSPTLAEGEAGARLVSAESDAGEPVSVLMTAGVEADAGAPQPDADRGDPWQVIPSFPAVDDAPGALLETPGWRPRTER